MSVATESAKQSSKRDVLLRMEPGYDLTDELTTVSFPTFTATMPYKPNRVVENGNSIAFTWVESTGLLTVTLTTTPFASHPVIAYFYVFATTGQAKYLDEDDPTGAISTVAEWLPRISTTPTVKTSIGDILKSRLYSSSSGIKLVNSDRHYDQYFNRGGDTEKIKVVFIDKEILVWFGYNDEYTLSFYGTIVKAGVDGNNFAVQMKDSLRKFRKTCLFGDDQSENYIAGANVQRTRQNKPIPFVYGASMPATGDHTTTGAATIETTNENPDGWYQLATLTDADYGDYTGSGKNKTLLMGRTSAALEANNVSFSFTLGGVGDTITNTGSAGSTTYRIIKLALADRFRVSVYCQLKVTWSVSGAVKQPVALIDYDTGLVMFNDYAGETISSVVRERPFALAVNLEYLPGLVALFTEDVTVGSLSSAATSGGNLTHTYTHTGARYRPDYPHYFTLFLANTPTVEYIAEDLFQKAGYTNSSISTSNTTPEFFSLPFGSETDFKTYDHYISLLLAPKLKTVKLSKTDSLDMDLADIYSTIDEANQPSTIYEIDETYILENSLKSSVDYQDIANEMELLHGECEHTNMKLFLVNQKFASLQTKQLYGVENRPVVYNTSTVRTGVVRIDDYWELSKEPKVVYQLDLPVKWYDLIPGDYIKVTSSQLPTAYDDGSEWVLLFITDVSKSIGKVSVTARTVEYTT